MSEYVVSNVDFRPHFFEAYEGSRTDMVGWSRHRGSNVWASHCIGCGRYAHLLAGDQSVRDDDFHPWQVTDCKQCGLRAAESHWNDKRGWADVEIDVPKRLKDLP